MMIPHVPLGAAMPALFVLTSLPITLPPLQDPFQGIAFHDVWKADTKEPRRRTTVARRLPLIQDSFLSPGPKFPLEHRYLRELLL